MATVSVSVNVNKRELERLIRRAPAEASRAVQKRTDALRDDIVRRMPRRTGETGRKTRAVMRGPYDGAVEIPEVPGRFLIEGTGIYGPRNKYIYPKTARFLAWRGANGAWIFARRVKGIKPHPFAQEAARHAANPLARLVAGIFGGR